MVHTVAAMDVLLVEDDPRIARVVERALTDVGHRVEVAHDGLAGLTSAERGSHDLVVLDVMLPEMDGFEVARELRRQHMRTPILMLTARDAVPDRVRGLDAGADDYLTKPFNAAQLDARIRAVLRRAVPEAPTAPIVVGDLAIDASSRTAHLEGRALELTRKEFDLLLHLAQNAGRVVTKRELLAVIWEQPYGGADKTVDVHLSWLRRKLGETAAEPRYLRTVRGVGVRLVAPDQP
jgi:DNA-binding response OmpR family regulator